MPFYEYQCGDCDHRIEVLQKISDEPLVFCPQCNASSLKKLVSAAAFRLKGSGWYETDFKHNHKQKENDQKEGAQKKGTQKEKGSAEKPSNLKSESSGSSDKPSDKNGNASQPNKSTKDTPSKGTSSKERTASAAT